MLFDTLHSLKNFFFKYIYMYILYMRVFECYGYFITTHRCFSGLWRGTKDVFCKNSAPPQSLGAAVFHWALKSQWNLPPSLSTVVMRSINQNAQLWVRRVWRASPMWNNSGCLKTHLCVRVNVRVRGLGPDIGPQCQPPRHFKICKINNVCIPLSRRFMTKYIYTNIFPSFTGSDWLF